MKWISRVLGIGMLLLQLAVLECSSRWWIVHKGDPLQRARRVLTLDEELGWRARAHLDLEFEGKKLVTDDRGLRVAPSSSQKRDSKKILVLGPSSAFGWGVQYEEAWPALIADNSVLNASQIGYSIVQGHKLYAWLRSQGLTGVKTVVIAYGVNDIDRFRFFDQENLSDVEYFRQLGQNKLLGGIYASGILSLLARGYQEAGIYFHCGYPKPPVQRVGADGFAEQLKDLILELRKDNMRVVLVNSANAIQVEPSDLKADESDRLYQESANAAAQKQCGLSRRLFFEAKQYESWRVIRDIKRINQAMEKTGAELGVPVVDIDSRLGGAEKKSYFVDPIHFSAKGHRLAADVIKNALTE